MKSIAALSVAVCLTLCVRPVYGDSGASKNGGEGKGSKAVLCDVIAVRGGMSAEEAEAQIRLVFSAIADELRKGNSVTIRGFGRFYTYTRQARSIRLPKRGKRVRVPKKRYPRFTSSETLKREVNAKSN